MPLYFSALMSPIMGTTQPNHIAYRHAKGMPTFKGAPSVRAADRRCPGTFGLFRVLVALIDDSSAR
ncbi:hypothetical protein O4H53_12575 [Sulfitobacter sp. G21635-S1]|nr:hypothetical protein [Sulfitobacter sp. G21635-S1]